jgi:uncharacterized protein
MPLPVPLAATTRAAIVGETVRWLERAVIGLNLCPFAKAVHVKGQVRYAVSEATSPAALLGDLRDELASLAAAPPNEVDTTLLIHPQVLEDFADYNDFLGEADALLAQLGLEGVLQIASFHPRYCFADGPSGDPANFTNRSPYPMLHLLREDSVSRAVAAFPDPSQIYERNMQVLRALPAPELRALFGDDD